jgi:hypothetical protein
MTNDHNNINHNNQATALVRVDLQRSIFILCPSVPKSNQLPMMQHSPWRDAPAPPQVADQLAAALVERLAATTVGRALAGVPAEAAEARRRAAVLAAAERRLLSIETISERQELQVGRAAPRRRRIGWTPPPRLSWHSPTAHSGWRCKAPTRSWCATSWMCTPPALCLKAT